MRGLRAEQKVRVQVHGRFEAARCVEAHGDGRGLSPPPPKVRVHAERLRHVRVGRDVDVAQWDRLQRLCGNLPQHCRGPEANLLSRRRVLGCPRGVSFGAHDIVQRCDEVGVSEGVGYDPVDDAPGHLSPAA